jgi:hypothetical protein
MMKLDILTLKLNNLHICKIKIKCLSLMSMEMQCESFCTRSNLIPMV